MKYRDIVTGGAERPSFEKFVDYLLRTDVADYNDHWIPIWLHCRICQMEYDAIGQCSNEEFTVLIHICHPRFTHTYTT